MTLQLIPLGVLSFTLHDTQVLRKTPVGMRVIVQFTDVKLEGERVTAEQSGPHAADWLSISEEGVATLDIRFLLRTSSGELIYVHGLGKTDANTFAKGAPMYFFPSFEVGPGPLAWLNGISVVAKGVAQGKQARFELFEVQ